jgi:C4-dicarboxylate-specific signal transduction histidine kinase
MIPPILSFQRLSIRGKLRLLVLQASSVAVLMSCVAFVSNDVRMIRTSVVKQVLALAEVLGANSTAAIEFDDFAAGKEILSSLGRQQAVDSACLYNAAGRVFSSYNKPGTATTLPATPPAAGITFTSRQYFDVVQSVVREGRIVGTIYLHASVSEVQDQIFRYLGIVVVVMAATLSATFILSTRLQKAISLPILNLTQTAARISSERDYSIRVEATSMDELGTLYRQFNAMLTRIQEGERALQTAHDNLEEAVHLRTHELSDAILELHREIKERTRAETELQNMHQQFMDAARRAGMAEIATGVLHNIGNVLNSINVSASVATDRLKASRIDQLIRAIDMLSQHAHDLGQFLTVDPKGKQVPSFLAILALHLNEEKTEILQELEHLTVKIDHVKAIVATQQSYACVSGVTEIFDVASAIDDALKLNAAVFDRHKIEIVRDYELLPKVQLDRQKLLQILVNLVKNGKDALVESRGTNRQLTFRTRSKGHDQIEIQVSDTGIGIKKENLTRIFTHGFTTKKTGHGFGLHSCANTAKEMGGALIVESSGVGQGATFTLDLPLIAKEFAS